MNRPKEKKRRIVPVQITSPTESRYKVDALSGPLQVGDLKKQAEEAKKLLGPGRKIYVDLVPYQKDLKEVNWRKVGLGWGWRDDGGRGTIVTLLHFSCDD